MHPKIDHRLSNELISGLNSNSLIARGPANPNQKSFANELTKMREATAAERESLTDLDAPVVEPSSKAIQEEPEINLGVNLVKEVQDRIKDIRDKEVQKEQFIDQAQEETQRLSEEFESKAHRSETLKAEVSQGNSKTITEAVKEGNVAPQEYNHYDANERKRQLANWEDLAPKIIEDSVNKAIRIDIPGIYDIETLIVRMNKNAVSVQAVGSKDAMDRLHNGQSELASILRKHDINLSSLSVYDADVLHAQMSKQAKLQSA